MYTIQPPLIKKYFRKIANDAPSRTYHYSHYLSWEDALWHLLTIHKFENGGTILVPDFYCFNVVSHMREHGLTVYTYPVDKYLASSKTEFEKILKEKLPDIVVVFHMVGVHSNLLKNHRDWLPLLPKNALLIEDCVHNIIDEDRIKFLHRNHYLIDSLRKVVPVQGSRVYSQDRLPRIGLSQSIQTLPYRTLVLGWWIAMQSGLILAYKTKNQFLSKQYNSWSEWAMKRGYELIGKNYLASPRLKVMEWLAKRINVLAIEKCKQTQVKYYVEHLKELTNSNMCFTPKIDQSDWGRLRGYPVVLDLRIADQVLQKMRKLGILIRFELDDSPWSLKQKIVYLPLGIHMNRRELKEIVGALKQSLVVSFGL